MERQDQSAPVPGQDLPAPYQDPWTLLGRDLRALAATGRLALWELTRRNRQGELAVPVFWPHRLRPWFWPLALSLGLAAVLALVLVLAPLRPHRRPPPVSAPPPARPAAASEAGEPAQPSATPASPIPAAAATPGPGAQAQADAAAELPGPELSPPEALPDPLLHLLAPADPQRLIQSLRALPERSCLMLQLAPSFAALRPEAQQRQAEDWLAKARELGYERLELGDGSGRLLGRTARVGSGMILLSPAAPAADAP
ncbi:MAG: hypothetical protein AAFX65_00520 [Cyanobacteria bacterium J06638_7]